MKINYVSLLKHIGVAVLCFAGFMVLVDAVVCSPEFPCRNVGTIEGQLLTLCVGLSAVAGALVYFVRKHLIVSARGRL